jgi:transcriptional regulator with XRE-family HTH domain
VQDKNNVDCLGVVVKSSRQAMQLTQSQLAEQLGITVRYLKLIENSGRKPSYDLLVRIIRELGFPADTVFYPEHERPLAKIYKLWGDKKPG